MLNRHNLFKSFTRFIAGKETANDLSHLQKKELFQQTQQYIIVREVLDDLADQLEQGETIAAYFPITNEENSSFTGTGLMGMMYVKTDKGKAYRDQFNDLRGNRLLVLTDRRMIFLVILEFIENRLYYSYPYDSLPGIQLEKQRAGFFNWQSVRQAASRQTEWYVLDFQSDNHIFHEILTVKEGALFLETARSIPALRDIVINNEVHRTNRFDYVFSNLKLAKQLLQFASWGLVALFLFIVVMFILRLFFGIGMFDYLQQLI
ncbi:hypothetical protein [Vagococcus acidifermentans]|uniref:YokE-like PH domain-containing protein n=1 Tax=Vagococcus acidifermentans TaxID=564710 RepID=A0A430B0A2_9ENTE|nr:hypothetical protein [Vagococcus acidifermentans]RSU13748.1 hypothetical protein CBF27_02275 [Vagococcus acidifermentans]